MTGDRAHEDFKRRAQLHETERVAAPMAAGLDSPTPDGYERLVEFVGSGFVYRLVVGPERAPIIVRIFELADAAD